jgi:hypothetical protein
MTKNKKNSVIAKENKAQLVVAAYKHCANYRNFIDVNNIG